MTNKQTYLRSLLAQPTDWIEASAANPSAHMTWMHVALHKLELRRRGRIQSHYADVAQSEGWQ
jgi:hypothetical protein